MLTSVDLTVTTSSLSCGFCDSCPRARGVQHSSSERATSRRTARAPGASSEKLRPDIFNLLQGGAFAAESLFDARARGNVRGPSHAREVLKGSVYLTSVPVRLQRVFRKKSMRKKPLDDALSS